ncbi:phospholipid-hydroperoxide glutathione peroxidase [Pancytospora philotis]|nr:phospholipid-hydroperoxide glutathione peroxidase [Pancytospora philotis]KAI4291098.1 phospholipid-hydroperoxide glutathione peroxidase [Pancytospora philotis]
MQRPDSIYDIRVRDYCGRPMKMEEYRGKVLLIVNVASRCGLAHKAYTALASLLSTYHKKGLRILLFPCKQFMNQEYASISEVKKFAEQYDDRFDLMEMVDVSGQSIHPLYKYLTDNLTGWLTNSIKWNFTVFLVGRNGELVQRYGPTEALKHDDAQILACIGSVPDEVSMPAGRVVPELEESSEL